MVGETTAATAVPPPRSLPALPGTKGSEPVIHFKRENADPSPNPSGATGAPLPGINTTGLSTEGIATVVTVVDRFLTFIPEPTELTWFPGAGTKRGIGVTYRVTAAGTVTVTDCPCTITTVCFLSPLLLFPPLLSGERKKKKVNRDNKRQDASHQIATTKARPSCRCSTPR